MSKNKSTTKILLKVGDYRIQFEIPSDQFDSIDSSKLMEQLKNTLYEVMHSCRRKPLEEVNITTKNIDVKEETTLVQNKETAPIVNKKDDFHIRTRIPNNVVDVNTLTIGKANTENALVRCPKCGQSHCVIVKDGPNLLMLGRDFKKNEFRVIIDSFTEEEIPGLVYKENNCSKVTYFKDLQKIVSEIKKEVDFVVNNETEMFCPVCKESTSFIEWKKAFLNPLEYFETEQLCNVCGGEVVTKLIKRKTVHKCEVCKHEEKIDE